MSEVANAPGIFIMVVASLRNTSELPFSFNIFLQADTFAKHTFQYFICLCDFPKIGYLKKKLEFLKIISSFSLFANSHTQNSYTFIFLFASATFGK